MLEIIFEEDIRYIGRKYTGLTNPIEHIEYCRVTWEACLRQEWVHQFIHTLDMIPRSWYTSVELRQGTIEWDELNTRFIHKFEFSNDHLSIDVTLQVIKIIYLNISMSQ